MNPETIRESLKAILKQLLHDSVNCVYDPPVLDLIIADMEWLIENCDKEMVKVIWKCPDCGREHEWTWDGSQILEGVSRVLMECYYCGKRNKVYMQMEDNEYRMAV